MGGVGRGGRGGADSTMRAVGSPGKAACGAVLRRRPPLLRTVAGVRRRPAALTMLVSSKVPTTAPVCASTTLPEATPSAMDTCGPDR